MLDIKISPRKNRPSESNEKVLVIDGKVIENSWAISYSGENSGGIYDPDDAEYVLSHPISEILRDISKLQISYEPLWCGDIKSVGFLNEARIDGQSMLQFNFSFESEEWSRPWSIAEFATTIEQVASQRAIAGLSVFRDDDFVINGFGFSCLIPDSSITGREEIDRWVPSLRDLMASVFCELAIRAAPNSVTAIFQFPEEISTACSQYLIYFGQFLADAGIDALVNLSETEEHILFRVTPKDSVEALEAIRLALAAYLNIPGDSKFLADSSCFDDIAVLQLKANVSHLESQLALSHAVIQAKDATIQALKFSNFQLQQIALPPFSSHVHDKNHMKDTFSSVKDSEAIVEGLISIRESDLKGLVIHWPELLRRLKRRFRWGEN